VDAVGRQVRQVVSAPTRSNANEVCRIVLPCRTIEATAKVVRPETDITVTTSAGRTSPTNWCHPVHVAGFNVSDQESDVRELGTPHAEAQRQSLHNESSNEEVRMGTLTTSAITLSDVVNSRWRQSSDDQLPSLPSQRAEATDATAGKCMADMHPSSFVPVGSTQPMMHFDCRITEHRLRYRTLISPAMKNSLYDSLGERGRPWSR
jgi:hypothetical protein